MQCINNGTVAINRTMIHDEPTMYASLLVAYKQYVGFGSLAAVANAICITVFVSKKVKVLPKLLAFRSYLL